MTITWRDSVYYVQRFITEYGADADESLPLPVAVEGKTELKEYGLEPGEVLLVTQLHYQSCAILRDTSSMKLLSISLNNPLRFYWSLKTLHANRRDSDGLTADTLMSILGHPECFELPPKELAKDLTLTPDWEHFAAVEDSIPKSFHTFKFVDTYETVCLAAYKLGEDIDTLKDDNVILIPGFANLKLRPAVSSSDSPTVVELAKKLRNKFSVLIGLSLNALSANDYKMHQYNSKSKEQDFAFKKPDKSYVIKETVDVILCRDDRQRKKSDKTERKTSWTNFVDTVKRKVSKSHDPKTSKQIADELRKGGVSSNRISSVSTVTTSSLGDDEGYQSGRTTVYSAEEPFEPPRPYVGLRRRSISEGNLGLPCDLAALRARRDAVESSGSGDSDTIQEEQVAFRLSYDGGENPYEELPDITEYVDAVSALAALKSPQAGAVHGTESSASQPSTLIGPSAAMGTKRSRLPPPTPPKPAVASEPIETIPEELYVNAGSFPKKSASFSLDSGISPDDMASSYKHKTGSFSQESSLCTPQETERLARISEMCQTDVLETLKELKLQKHIEKFLEEEVDGELLKTLDKEALQELGLSPLEACKLHAFVCGGWKPASKK